MNNLDVKNCLKKKFPGISIFCKYSLVILNSKKYKTKNSKTEESFVKNKKDPKDSRQPPSSQNLGSSIDCSIKHQNLLDRVFK